MVLVRLIGLLVLLGPVLLEVLLEVLETVQQGKQ
jgi:hypothetical protein